MQHDTALQARMDALIAEWEQVGDRRSVFLACYNRMTVGMFAAIAAGRFHDAAWVRRLTHEFADYYFVALEVYERQDAHLPVVWQRAFELAQAPGTPVVQSLLLGVNAHINYDLVQVLADLLEPEWDDLNPEQRRMRFQDYTTVNEVIAATIDSVQDDVIRPYARLMGLFDLACGPLDEWCTARLLRLWRADVWGQAITIVETPDLPGRLELRRRADDLALQRVHLMLEGGALGARAFGYPLRWLGRLRLL
jgi:hypothetical protein